MKANGCAHSRKPTKGKNMSKVWKIAPGEHADTWEMCRQEACIALGWRKLKASLDGNQS